MFLVHFFRGVAFRNYAGKIGAETRLLNTILKLEKNYNFSAPAL
jgi:hypothetical protein